MAMKVVALGLGICSVKNQILADVIDWLDHFRVKMSRSERNFPKL